MSISSKIAEYIRKGWRLSSLHCPVCNTPLVSRNGKYFCAVCSREVRVVKSEAEYREALMENILERLKLNIISALERILSREDWYFDSENLSLVTKYLDILKLIREVESKK